MTPVIEVVEYMGWSWKAEVNWR